MVRTITHATLLGLLGTLLVTALVVAQQPGMSGHMSMETMMRECRTHCQETTASIDQMMTTMSQAHQSNDPAQMREALAQAQQPLAAMKDHMAQCMSMMSMMQQMPGGMGGPMPQKK
jgi:hypothetical protein